MANPTYFDTVYNTPATLRKVADAIEAGEAWTTSAIFGLTPYPHTFTADYTIAVTPEVAADILGEAPAGSKLSLEIR